MTIFDLMYDSFSRANGLFLALLSLAVGLFLWVVHPSSQIPIWPVATAMVLGIIIVYVLFDAIRASVKNWGRAPGVRRVKEAEPLPEGNKGIRLIIEPSQQFYIDSMITLYGREDDFDIQLGIGYVETVNEKKYIQAVIYEIPLLVNRHLWDDICTNDHKYLSLLRVRPSVPRSFLFD
jgi:hypothetical protein